VIYFLVKALHIGAVVIWIGGTITIAALMSYGVPNHISVIKRFYNQVVTPALLLTWVFGMTLALLGDWFPTAWLIAKIAIVLVLSGLHGFIARDLRLAEERLLAGHEDIPTPLPVQARRSWLVASAAFVVILLVTFKV